MIYPMDAKEAYRYVGYFKNQHCAKIKTLPTMPAIINPILPDNHYSKASKFMDLSEDKGVSGDFDDFFNQKKELGRDKVNLILDGIYQRETIKYNNLKLLYEDLLRINNWRLERPYPDNYKKDRLWSDLNRSELQIRDQIRREMKDAARDMAFTEKDLRESLLEFKVQAQKNNMFESGMEIEPDGSQLYPTGDADYPINSLTQNLY